MWFDNPEVSARAKQELWFQIQASPPHSTGLLQLSSPRVGWAGLAQAGWQQAASARGRLGNADEAPIATAAVALWAPTAE